MVNKLSEYQSLVSTLQLSSPMAIQTACDLNEFLIKLALKEGWSV